MMTLQETIVATDFLTLGAGDSRASVGALRVGEKSAKWLTTVANQRHKRASDQRIRHRRLSLVNGASTLLQGGVRNSIPLISTQR